MTVINFTYPNPKFDPKYTGEPSLDYRDALTLVPLFYTILWTEEKRAEWLRITGTTEATTKVLCDHIRFMIDALDSRREEDRIG